MLYFNIIIKIQKYALSGTRTRADSLGGYHHTPRLTVPIHSKVLRHKYKLLFFDNKHVLRNSEIFHDFGLVLVILQWQPFCIQKTQPVREHKR